MTPIECEFESEVLAAVIQSRWPERANPELRAHVAGCSICSDVTVVAAVIGEAVEAPPEQMAVPDSGRIWWMAQLRARRENARTAGRPITAVQVLAFACAMGLLGACFGATSAWFQQSLNEARRLMPLAVTLLAEHSALAVAVLALAVLVPGAVYLVVARD